jgi:hypothetical protein
MQIDVIISSTGQPNDDLAQGANASVPLRKTVKIGVIFACGVSGSPKVLKRLFSGSM